MVGRKTEKTTRTTVYRALLERPEALGEDFAALGLGEKELFKHTVVEIVPVDVGRYIAAKQLSFAPTAIVAYFDPSGTGATVFSAPLSTLFTSSASA